MDKNVPGVIGKRFTWVQICWIIAEFILIGSATLALCNPVENLVSISVYLGLSMLIVGSINIFVHYRKQKMLHGSHWLLADGMSTVLLSFFPLFNKMIQPSMIPLFFGVWELFSGILKAIDSSELKEENIRGWKWFRNIGTLEIMSGVASLLKPVDELMGMNVIVAIIFFLQSCGFLFKILIYPQIARKSEKEYA